MDGFFDPPSGTLIVNFEGAENVTTIVCELFGDADLENRTTTLWFIQDFGDQPGDQQIRESSGTFSDIFLITGADRNVSVDSSIQTYRNNLTILSFDANLDGATVYCNSGGNMMISNYSLRIYRKES